MKNTIIRSAITIILCTFAVGGWAVDNVIFEDDFTSLSDVGNNMLVSSRIGWSSLTYCHRSFNVTMSNPALRIDRLWKEHNGPEGYATTKELGYTGDCSLSFSHAYTASGARTKARVILSGGAIFKENNASSIEVDVTTYMTSSFITTTLHLANVSTTTTITFESTSDSYYAIDDILIVPDGIVLSETTDKAITNSIIEANDTKTVKVNTTRTLTGGIWNTLCLPFDVTMADLESA